MIVKPKVTLISVGRSFFDTDYAAKKLKETEKEVASLFELTTITKVVTDLETAASIKEKVVASQPELIVVQYGTFALWSLLDLILSDIEAPIVLWVIPEPPGDGKLRLNSMCGVNLGANYLSLKDKWFKVVYGEANDQDLLDEVLTIARAAKAKAFLNGSRLGVLGEPPAGFYPWQSDQESMKRKFGVEIVNISLDEVLTLAERYRPSILPEELKELEMKEKVSEEQMKKSYGLQRAIAEKRKELNLSALAVRCWPECPEKYGAMACWAMSVLSATGIPCACEGDIYGALTQLIQFGITGINPALLDLVDIERLTNTMVFWHCGAAPYNLAAGKVKGMLHPNRRVGLSLDFELQGAEFTGARLSIGREAHRLLVFYGKKAPMPKHFNGTSLAISVEESVLEKVKIILNTGYEHHYSLVGADIRKELTLFGEMLRLQVQKI